ncbi:MAG: hypothetical protein ACRDZX_05245 [Acidimicrobiales bacterium]
MRVDVAVALGVVGARAGGVDGGGGEPRRSSPVTIFALKRADE